MKFLITTDEVTAISLVPRWCVLGDPFHRTVIVVGKFIAISAICDGLCADACGAEQNVENCKFRGISRGLRNKYAKRRLN